MDAVISIKRAAEKHLMEITPAVSTAFEGAYFEPPNGLYQRCQHVVKNPDDPVWASGYYRERVQFQVFVVGQLGNGTIEILTQAGKVREKFKKGTYLNEDGIGIFILTTPQIGGTSVVGDNIVVPVLIDLIGEVSLS
jgi:hypothetical protein